MTARVLVAMSGGVDSSVAAALLAEEGHELVGVTLHLWDAEGPQKVGRCCAPEDREDARRVCDHLGIPHYVIDQREPFRQQVVDPFVEAYAEGRTPSPCVACNQTVKLAYLVELAHRFGASQIATGHYARVEHPPGNPPRLLRGCDPDKDQSYFLFGGGTNVLSRLRLPLGALTKDQTRQEGRRLGVPNADKPDSQELCFVPDGDVRSFVARAGGAARPGSVVDTDGQVLGQHEGLPGFTVGQRRGLGLGGGPPRYVLRLVPERDEVVVGPANELWVSHLRARDARWVAEEPPSSFAAEVRIRHRHRPARATVRPRPGGFDVEFAEPQRAAAPGQASVVYRGDEVVGGGFITGTTGRAEHPAGSP